MISHLIVNYQAIKPKHKANHYLALRLLDALNGKRVDWNVAGLVAREGHLAALLVALGDLLTIWGRRGSSQTGPSQRRFPKSHTPSSRQVTMFVFLLLSPVSLNAPELSPHTYKKYYTSLTHPQGDRRVGVICGTRQTPVLKTESNTVKYSD